MKWSAIFGRGVWGEEFGKSISNSPNLLSQTLSPIWRIRRG
jgi:hypothetical protein